MTNARPYRGMTYIQGECSCRRAEEEERDKAEEEEEKEEVSTSVQ